MQINIPTKIKIILAILITLLAFSAYLAYDFHQNPLTRTTYVPTCSYQQTVNYDCTVYVKPSIVYDNRTTLQPGETAYIHLVKHVDISLAYSFTSNPPQENFELNYNITATLEAEKEWRRSYILTPEKTQNLTDIHETYTLDIEETDALIKEIEKEANIHAYTYNYKIVPKIHINASTPEGTITEDYTPTLTITLDYSKRKLILTGLTNTKTGSIGDYQTSETTWTFASFTTTIKNMRYISYALVLLFCGCLTLTAWRTQKMPPPSFIDTIKKEYREKIIEAKEPLTKKVEKATIKVESVEDLAKVSEETFKPIIHETSTVKKGEVKRHTFYVLDANIKYELMVEEPTE